MDRIKIFISYAYQDEKLVQELLKHLQHLEEQFPFVSLWSHRDILPGQDAQRAIRENLERANIILFLVSPGLLHSKRDELTIIETKYRSSTAHVIPIIIRPTNWSQTFFAHLKSLPVITEPLSISKSPTLTYWEILEGVEAFVRSYIRTGGDIKMKLSKQEINF